MLDAATTSPPYRQSAQVVLQAARSDPAKGLSELDAKARLARYGPNELRTEKPTPGWRRFLAQFQDPLVILLLVATVISVIAWVVERESSVPYEAIVIVSVVLLNAIMGYVQESRAESAMGALRRMAAAQAHVVRDGEPRAIDATAVVPGDVLLVEEGDTVAADARVFRSTALQTAEASLTGESLPVAKDAAAIPDETTLGDRHNMIFTGTTVSYGRGRAVVVATGMSTEMGRIAGMLRDAPEETTPLQRELARVGKVLGMTVVAIAVVMVATIVLVEQIRGLSALLDVLILGVALAVAAVPEGLPAVVTAVLSLGVQRMARRRAIVRHLRAVETLGSATVIASDKTGTLTKNEMTVRVVVTASGRMTMTGTGYAPYGEVTRDGGGAVDGLLRAELERTLAVGDRANNAVVREEAGRWTIQGDPTEAALVVAARKAGLSAEALAARLPRIGEVPFSAERKLMSTVHADTERQERLLVFSKGAPDILLGRCTHELVGEEFRPLTEARRAEIRRLNDELAGGALRTLGIACRALPADAFSDAQIDEQIERDLVFAGLVGIMDPPRPEAADAVSRAKQAGIRPLMITGDHPRTAEVIAADLGIADLGQVVTGAQIERMSDAVLAGAVPRVSVFARVNPEHKLRIVKALRSRGAVVAMTGDGVNDAPALKTADIGVAMGVTGTDVSKGAADIVLADDDFATIVAAVEEGRTIFANVRKFLRYLLSSNLGEVMAMFFGVLLAKRIGLHAEGSDVLVLPLLATQLLWINLISDGAPALALGLDPAEPGLMQRPPRPTGERVITPGMWGGIVLVGAATATATLLALDLSLPGGLAHGSGTMKYAQTMAFTTLALAQVFNVFNARSERGSAFRGLFQNRRLWVAVGLTVLSQVAVIYVPFLQLAFSTVSLRMRDWLRCVGLASSVLWVREASKLLLRLRRSRPWSKKTGAARIVSVPDPRESAHPPAAR
jgi:Ca2+-transporting ATPase